MTGFFVQNVAAMSKFNRVGLVARVANVQIRESLLRVEKLLLDEGVSVTPTITTNDISFTLERNFFPEEEVIEQVLSDLTEEELEEVLAIVQENDDEVDDLILIFLITSEEESELLGEGDGPENQEERILAQNRDDNDEKQDKERKAKNMCLAT